MGLQRLLRRGDERSEGRQKKIEMRGGRWSKKITVARTTGKM